MSDFLEQYTLEPFPVNVQTPERTFIDKVFTLCDYWWTGKITEHSRHLYDLAKLYPIIERNQAFFDLTKKVRKLRSQHKRCQHKRCPSAQPECNINSILKEIAEANVYKSDYENVTENILFESWPCEKAKEILPVIVKMKLFDR